MKILPMPKTRKAFINACGAKRKLFRLELGLSRNFDVQAKSVNPLHRVRPDGSLQRQIVAELVQKNDTALLDPNNPAAGTFTFRGGTTILINRQGEVRYSISKPMDGPAGEERLKRQREYLSRLQASFALAPYIPFNPDRDLSFQGIHRGY